MNSPWPCVYFSKIELRNLLVEIETWNASCIAYVTQHNLIFLRMLVSDWSLSLNKNRDKVGSYVLWKYLCLGGTFWSLWLANRRSPQCLLAPVHIYVTTRFGSGPPLIKCLMLLASSHRVFIHSSFVFVWYLSCVVSAIFSWISCLFLVGLTSEIISLWNIWYTNCLAVLLPHHSLVARDNRGTCRPINLTHAPNSDFVTHPDQT